MGSSPPRDQGTMTAASSGATAADASLAKQADQSTAYAKQAHDALFGPLGVVGPGQGGGTLSKFLDPGSLNVSAPTGPYSLQYNKAVEGIANQGEQNRGAIARGFASRGFGNMPAGFTADQSRQELADESNQKGAAFTDFAGKSYADAVNNFWNATNIASGSGAANTNAAISADSSAANNYANLYGTASTPNPSLLPQIVGGTLQSAGAVGAAAACPCEGSMILMHDGTEKPVQEIHKGFIVRGIDGEGCEILAEPQPSEVECVKVTVARHETQVSSTHTFALAFGGYVCASDCMADVVLVGRTKRGFREADPVENVQLIGKKMVYLLELGGSHTYRADNIWALS